jgi:hypothetical protein
VGWASHGQSRIAGGGPLTTDLWAQPWNTGYASAPGYPGSLADGSALTITSNTTYSFYNFPSGVTVNSGVTGVTFYGCQFTQSGGVSNMAVSMNNASPNNGFTFSWCTFGPAGVAEPGPPGGVTLAQSYQYGVWSGAVNSMTIRYCDFWGFGNAAWTVSGGSQANPNVFLWNYVHDMCLQGSYHGDGVGSPGGGTDSYAVIQHCNVQAAGDTQGLAYQNSPGPSTWSNFMITSNLWGGFGYTINVLDGTTGSPSAPSNITFTDNTFSTQLVPGFGPIYDTTYISTPNWLWRRNKWLVPPGAGWGHAAYNGYYWMPVGTSIAGPSLDELSAGLVSLTDYTG